MAVDGVEGLSGIRRGVSSSVGGRRASWLRALSGALLLLSASIGARAEPFPRPSALEPAVRFWRAIFSEYSELQEVVHDDRYLDHVYSVLDFSDRAGPDGKLSSAEERRRDRVVRREKERIRKVLLHIQRVGPASPALDADERRIARLLADLPGRDRYRRASDRLRSQSGLRERFAAGIARQSGYLDAMERIFRARGLPVGLVRLPLFESCFDLDAYSKAGAAGVWQFMPSTGRRYLRIDGSIDERRDPLRATEAAAELLRQNYEALGSWPLAITAYNHGRAGVRRAVAAVGSRDLGRIVQEYRGRSFGFASRNFYAEFLAAVDVADHAEQLFGPIPHVPAPRSREIQLRRSMRLREASRVTGVERAHLIAMNPAFLSRVIRERSPIPRGYRLRLPLSERDVRVALARPSAASRAAIPPDPPYVIHTVRRGQTLSGIARRYGTSVRIIQGLNGVRRPRALRVGQKLRIPRR